MDNGLAYGIYSNKLEGNANGLYDSISTGLHNGTYNENIIDNGIVKNGLVLYLDASQNYSYVRNGTSWKDLSNNNNNGILTNDPKFNSANRGNIEFDGINDYIEFGDILNPRLNNFSLGGWIKTTTTTVSGFIGKHRATGLVGRYGLFYSIATQSKVRAIIDFTSITGETLNSTSILNNNKWHYIFMTVNRTSNFVLYFDGVEEAKTNISSYSFVDLNASISYNLATYPDAVGTPSNFLNGNIAIAQHYNRELSAAEINQNYQATKSRFNL